jgi:tetratricopeptide (TPR) repeat protein
MARHDEALTQMEQASALDPLSAATITQHGYCLYRAGRLSEATARLRQAIVQQADFAPAHVGIGLVELQAHHTDAAIVSFERADALLDGTASHLTAYAYALGGQEARAREIAERLEKKRAAAAIISPTDLALLRVALGDTAGAFRVLEAAFTDHAGLATINSDPRFDALSGDPRYDDLIERMGFER